MQYFTELVPTWLSIAFLAAILIPVFMLAQLARKASAPGASSTRAFFIVLVFCFAYLTYVSLACFAGWFEAVGQPPMIVRYTMLPLLAFLMLVVFQLPAYKSMLRRVKLADLVWVHVFRIISSFFLLLYVYDALPGEIVFLTLTGDFVTVLSGVWLARAIRKDRWFALPVTWLWNTFGLLDILTSFADMLLINKHAMKTDVLGVDVLAEFPFCFFTAFIPAIVIFLHLSVYRKLFMKD